MKKVKIIELLTLVANGEIKNNQLVIIQEECFKYNAKELKFYSLDGGSYRIFKTSDLNNICYILCILEEYDN